MIAARGEVAAHLPFGQPQPAAADEEGTHGAAASFHHATPPSSPSPPVALASSPQPAASGLGRRLLGAIGLASTSNSKPPPPPAPAPAPGVIRLPDPEMGLGFLLHLELKGGGDQEEEEDGAAHHRDRHTKLASPSPAPSFTAGFGDHDDDPTVHNSLHVATTHDDTACAVPDHQEEEDAVHKCLDANSHEAPALAVAVGDIISSATSLQDKEVTDAKVQRLLDQDTSDQCKQTPQGIHHVGEEPVLEQCLGNPTKNVPAVEHWEMPLNHHECDAHGNDIALQGLRKTTEKCTNGELGATMDDSAVEDRVMVQPEGAIDKQGATMDDATVEDLEKAPEQCTRCEVEVMDANVVEDQELVEPEGVVGDEEKVIEKWSGDKSITNHEDALAEKEVVEQEGRLDRQGTIKDDNVVEYQEEEKVVEHGVVSEQIAIWDDVSGDRQEKLVQQCTSDDLRSTMDDNAVGSHEMVEQYVIDEGAETAVGIVVKYQEMAPEQCTSDELGGTVDGNAMGDQDVVEKNVIIERAEATGDIAVEDQEMATENRTSDQLGGTVDDIVVADQVAQQVDIDKRSEATEGIAVEDQLKAVGQCTLDESRGIIDDIVVENQEVVEQDVMHERGETTGDIAIMYQDKALEQRTSYQLGGTIDDIVVRDQEVVEQDVINKRAETTGDIAVEDQEMASEQCTSDELGGTIDDIMVADQDVVEQVAIYKRSETTEGIAVDDQAKVVEQCAMIDLGSDENDDVMEDREVVEQGVITENNETICAIVVEDQGKALEQCTTDELGVNWIGDTVEGQEVGVQGVNSKMGATMDHNAMEDQVKAVVLRSTNKARVNKDGNVVEGKEKVLEQSVIDKQGAMPMDGIAAKDQKEVEQYFGDELINNDENTVVGHKKVTEPIKDDISEHVHHETGATEDDLGDNTEASGDIIGILSSEVDSIKVNGSDKETLKEKVKLCVGYPQRPGKQNCPFYMSTGCCSYGLSCHFHHPMLKAKPDVSSVPSEQGDHEAIEILELNRVGLPIREGARNCTYYMRNGTCGYGKKCHYNHPDYAQFYPPTGWEDNALSPSPHLKRYSDHALDGTSYLKKSSDDVTLDDTLCTKISSDHATLDGTSYSKKSFNHENVDDTSSSLQVLPPNILRMLLPPQKIPPRTEEKTMMVKKDPEWSSVSDNSDGCCSADSSDGPLCKQEHVDYPERPGRPECPRFGDCNFASACKYHRLKDRFPSRYNSKDQSLGEELVEYPERPGEPECPFYMKSKFCKFGGECKFHHPKDLAPSRWSPVTSKKSVAAANEHHTATRITVKDHICQQQQYPERPGRPNCRYYMQFGKCKFLSACIFHHPKDRLSSEWHLSDPSHSDQHDTWQPISRKEHLCQQVQIWPEIPGMPECPFYMKTGTCQFGTSCEFRHPKDRCSTAEEAIGQRTDLAYDNFIRPENVLQQQEQTMYPERPGEPECSYYMRHGYCKFQMNCKFHHPRYRSSKNPYGSSSHC